MGQTRKYLGAKTSFLGTPGHRFHAPLRHRLCGAKPDGKVVILVIMVTSAAGRLCRRRHVHMIAPRRPFAHCCDEEHSDGECTQINNFAAVEPVSHEGRGSSRSPAPPHCHSGARVRSGDQRLPSIPPVSTVRRANCEINGASLGVGSAPSGRSDSSSRLLPRITFIAQALKGR